MKIHNLRLNALALTCLIALNPSAYARDASADVSAGAASIAASPLASIKGGPIEGSNYFVVGAVFVVAGIGEIAGNAMQVVIQNSVDGSKAVINASASVVRDLGLSVGNGITAVAESTGHTLMASGKVLAFVPNAIGKELLYQSKLSK